MKPFKMFFGIAVIILLFLFVVRIAVMAFIIAAIMSFIYAVYRRIKDYITYDRNGEHYLPAYQYSSRSRTLNSEVEPLFYEHLSKQYPSNNNTRFIEAV